MHYKKWLKRGAVVFLLLVISFVAYVQIVNRHSKNMTIKQKILKAVYPAFIWWTKLNGKGTKAIANGQTEPPVPFYSLTDTLINGQPFPFDSLRGKKVLLVNTASDCGYTPQYTGLEELFRQNKDHLVVIGFPANDFKEQEKGADADIAQFCKLNFGVSFPLMVKSSVVKGEGQNPVFTWLTDPSKNGWNSKQPAWNFSKYLVDERGRLTHYFGSSVEPMSDEVLNAIKK